MRGEDRVCQRGTLKRVLAEETVSFLYENGNGNLGSAVEPEQLAAGKSNCAP